MYQINKPWNLVEIGWAFLDMTPNRFWGWEHWMKFHEKSAHFCTLWEKRYYENQSKKLNAVKYTKLVFWLKFLLWLKPYS